MDGEEKDQIPHSHNPFAILITEDVEDESQLPLEKSQQNENQEKDENSGIEGMLKLEDALIIQIMMGT